MITKHDIEPVPSKVEAIVKAPPPANVQQLRSFLSLINYYGKFIPDLSTLLHPMNSLLHPMNSLLQSNKKWCWSKECSKAFQNAKNQLTSACILTHYNPSLPITLAADTSQYGVGTVISQMVLNFQ